MVMTSDDAFSPFESLLLVQTLAAHGPKPEIFEKISLSLREASPSRLSQDEDDTRFNEQSLKDRYLRLLKIEAKREFRESLERDHSPANGTANQPVAEQAMLSPKTPTLEESSRFSYLLPQLVVRLYDAYKEQVIREIRAEEKRYDDLLREIDQVRLKPVDSLEGTDIGTRDTGHTALADAASQQDVGQDSSHVGEQEPVPIASDKHNKQLVPPNHRAPQSPAKDQSFEQQAQPKTEASIRDILNTPVLEKATPSPPRRSVETLPRPYSKDITSPLRPAPPSQRRVPPPIAPASTSNLPPLQPVPPGYRLPGEAIHHSPYEPISQLPKIAPSPSPHYNGQHPYSSAVLPPPNALPLQPSPSTQWQPKLPNLEHPQQTPPSLALRPPVSEPNRKQLLPVADRESQISPSYPPRQQPHPTPNYPQPTSILPNPVARSGGIMLPPFQVTPHGVAAATPTLAHPVKSTVPATAHRIQSRSDSTPVGVIRSLQRPNDVHTPLSAAQNTPSMRAGPLLYPRPGVSFSPGSSTGWKVTPTAANIEMERPVWTPGFEDAFPMESSMTPKAKRLTKAVRADPETENSTVTSQPSPVSTAPKRGKSARSTSKTPSLAATSTMTRTRSQSVVSQSEEPAKRSVAGRRQVKEEPSTPAATAATESAPDSKTPAPRRGRPVKASAPAQSTKRKRAISDANTTDPLDVPTPLAPPSQTPLERTVTIDQPSTNPPMIMALRNFQKMTAPIMNNITSHKHASLFANPVKDRDAEGYTDIIRRPQDLKSIRAAIVAGSRTVAAFTASDVPGTPGTPRGGTGTGTGTNTPSGAGVSGSGGSGSITITLPWSQDLVPPRAIVNGAQLEQEVMRMFANAVMFNAGDEGVVCDTREMFESVEASIVAWRAAERNAAEQRGGPGSAAGGAGPALGSRVEGDADEPDELGDADDSMAQPNAKRRRAV